MALADTVGSTDGERGRGGGGDPTPRRLRLPLASLEDVGREMARVYRSARSGEIAVSDATKLAFILSTLGKVLEAVQFESRLTALEEITNEQQISTP
ncbi:MAG: hypothetical protein QFE16_00360 [Pseudomonadota bacterium]|nr:hypothetical protein [Pseudomonadota bacterium]